MKNPRVLIVEDEPSIAELVSVLHEAKGRLFDLRVSDADRRLMSFPDIP